MDASYNTKFKNVLLQFLENSAVDQTSINSTYENVVDILKHEMTNKLKSRTITIDSCNSNKKRRIRKPWWNNDLSLVWNTVCTYEKEFIKSRRRSLYNSRELKTRFVTKRKLFDKLVQQAKRRHWYDIQTENVSKSEKRSENDFGKILVKLEIWK